MEEYLLECDVLEMDLLIPKERAPAVADHFNQGRAGMAVTAELSGGRLRLETGSGRFVLRLHDQVFVPEDLEIMDGDRGGAFFGQVVVSLFLAFEGRLRCRVRWANPRHGTGGHVEEVVVEDGLTNWSRGGEKDRAAGAQASPGVALARSAEGLDAASDSQGAEELSPAAVEEALAKLEEAKRFFAQYQRMRDAKRQP